MGIQMLIQKIGKGALRSTIIPIHMKGLGLLLHRQETRTPLKGMRTPKTLNLGLGRWNKGLTRLDGIAYQKLLLLRHGMKIILPWKRCLLFLIDRAQ
jgi:hypothetical protein